MLLSYLEMKSNIGEQLDWGKERAERVNHALKLGIKLSVPEIKPIGLRDIIVVPRVAPDGRKDLETVACLRKEKDF